MLDAAEKLLQSDLEAAAGDFSARCSIVRTLCQVLDTRRVLVGDPLPGTLRPTRQTTLEMWRNEATPALPVPVSISHATSASGIPASGDATLDVQSAQVVDAEPIAPNG